MKSGTVAFGNSPFCMRLIVCSEIGEEEIHHASVGANAEGLSVGLQVRIVHFIGDFGNGCVVEIPIRVVGERIAFNGIAFHGICFLPKRAVGGKQRV